jgi:hypothetical protein
MVISAKDIGGVIFDCMKCLRNILLGAASLSLGPTFAQVSPSQHYDAQTHQPLYKLSYSLIKSGPTYKGFYYDPEYANGATWGIWYSNESMLDRSDLAQNPNYFQSRGGWGTEILSANLLPKISPEFKPYAPENWQSNGLSAADAKSFLEKSQTSRGALYAGMGIGMGFYGKGDRSNVTLNTVREDSGYTYLNNQSVSIWGKVHYEKKAQLAGVSLYPFVSLAAGPRIFFANQQVNTYLTLTEYESPTANSAFSDAVFATEFSVGTKIRLGSVVSLLVSQSWWSSADVTVVDLTQSRFNGLSFDLTKAKLSGSQSQWKVGFVFDLSEKRYHQYKVADAGVDTQWYYEVQMPPPVDSMVYDSVSKTYVKVKYFTCPCCLTNQNGQVQPQNLQAVPIYVPGANQQRNDAGRWDSGSDNPRFNNDRSNHSGSWDGSSSSGSSGSVIGGSGKLPAPTISSPKIKN